MARATATSASDSSYLDLRARFLVVAADTPVGNEVPLTISTGGQVSNSVTIAVR